MEPDLEREKSSSPSAISSSEEKTFHDSDDESAESSEPLMQHRDSTDDEHDDIEDDDDDENIVDNQEERVESAEENAVSVVEMSKHSKKDTPLQTKGIEFSHNDELNITKEALKLTDSELHENFSENTNKAKVEKVDDNIAGLNLTAKRPSILEEHFHDLADNESAKTVSDCYFSAQDFLEYGALLTSESKTPDLESGYYERSESDISRDDIELTRVNSKGSPHRQALSTISSEGLRQELNRFRAMIDIMERERMNNNNMQANLQETVQSVLSYEEKQSEQIKEDITAKTDKKQDIEGNNQRGYWSTVFGQASQIETSVELTLDERFADIQSRLSILNVINSL